MQSPNHPDLWDTAGPSTMNANETKRQQKKCKRELVVDMTKDKKSESSKKNARIGNQNKRLKSFDVSEIIRSKNIRTRNDLLALAHEQKMEGKTDLAEFVVNRGSKVVNDVIETTWEMEKAKDAQKRLQMSRLDLLSEAGQQNLHL